MIEIQIFPILVFGLLGILFGIFTGLVPGVHINLISGIFLFFYFSYDFSFEVMYFVIFIISLGITHTFLDFIPAVLFGIPSSDNVLSILPAHKLVNEGKGFLAIYLSSVGSLFGFIFSLVFLFFMYYFLENIYIFITPIISYILIFITILLILLEKGIDKKFWALLINLSSISLGLLVINSSILKSPLLVIFTGFFGVSAIIDSLNNQSSTIPKQSFLKIKNTKKKIKEFMKFSFVGAFVSLFTTVSPGIGNSQAATISSIFLKNVTSKNFIIITSAINTSGFIFSILTFYLIDRARNGSILAISQLVEKIEFYELIFYIAFSIFISFIGFFLTLKIGKFLLNKVQNLNFKKINISILVFLLFLVFYLENYIGLLVLSISTFLGILTINVGVKRIHLMGVLIGVVVFNLL
jgi:putative membrane protein